MIISRTPFRISFFGGGTDYPAWYREHGGAVLAATINRYCYITCRYLPPFFEHKSRIVWSRIERVDDHGDIQHPVVRAALQLLRIEQGVEIHHDGDLPSRAGLGSSSAFTVGILHALHALKGEMIGKADMARSAIHVEQEMLRESVGVQDQISTAYGGLNRIEIGADDSFQVEPLVLSAERMTELQRHLLMFYTGVSRSASSIAQDKIEQIPRRQVELHRMREMVEQGVAVLTRGNDIGDFGRLLHDAWQLKRSLSEKIAPAFVDDIYAAARAAGALGGKVLGAGGGGFMLFFADPGSHAAIMQALSRLLLVPIEFEQAGSQIIFYDRERYSRTALGERSFVRFGNGNGNGNGDGNGNGTANGHGH